MTHPQLPTCLGPGLIPRLPIAPRSGLSVLFQPSLQGLGFRARKGEPGPRLLLAVFGYQIMHAQRAILERATGTGWSLRHPLERVLRAPARFTVSGRRIVMIAECSLAELASPGPPVPAPVRNPRGSLPRPARIRRARTKAKAWHPCSRNRDTLALLSADRSPKPLQNDVSAAHLEIR